MISPISTPALVELLKTLDAAFDKRGVKDALTRAEVYRNGLRGLDASSIRAAVNLAIEQDQFFPRVARLRELATTWTRQRHRGDREPDHPAGFCPSCRTFAAPEERLRPTTKMGVNGGPALLTASGALVLESYVRDQCQCSPAAHYTPGMTAEDLQPARRTTTAY